jgi:hypothetical protein
MFRTLHLRPLDGDARAFGLGYLVLLPLYLAPLFVARLLPGLDLPFHLSMVDMLSKNGEATSPYQDHYIGSLGVAPYAAHYLALRIFSVVMPLLAAHKLVIALYVGAFPLATAALLNACGRSRLPALLAFPLAYNLTLHYGFVSFAISLPVLLFLLAALTRFLVDEPLRPSMGIATGLLAVLLFLCHLQNFLFGLCAAAAFILFAGVKWKRRLLALTTLAPALACLVIWHVTREFEGPLAVQRKSLGYAWEVLRRQRLIDLEGRAWLSDLSTRLKILPIHALRGFTDGVDYAACKALLVAIGGYMVVALVGLGAFSIGEPRPRMRIASWVVLLGAVVAYVGLPHHLAEFELMTFYPRFSVLVLALALVVIPGSLRRFDGVGRVMVLLPAFAVSALYSVELIRHYRYYDQEIADFVAVAEKVPPGGRALGLVFDRQSRVMRIESALVGLPHLYPALRPDPRSMSPIWYCGMRHMPCQRLSARVPIPDPGPWSPQMLDPVAASKFFDYLFLRLPPAGRPLFGTAHDKLRLLAQQGSWLVYQRTEPRRDEEPAAVPAGKKAPPSTGAKPGSPTKGHARPDRRGSGRR